MTTTLLMANCAVFVALVIHILYGDKDIKVIEPDATDLKKLENWIMARGAFHVVSVDLLMITIGLTLVNFSNILDMHRAILLQIMSIYFLLYAIAFFICIIISKPLPKKLLKLCQWALFMIMSGLIYFSI